MQWYNSGDGLTFVLFLMFIDLSFDTQENWSLSWIEDEIRKVLVLLIDHISGTWNSICSK